MGQGEFGSGDPASKEVGLRRASWGRGGRSTVAGSHLSGEVSTCWWVTSGEGGACTRGLPARMLALEQGTPPRSHWGPSRAVPSLSGAGRWGGVVWSCPLGLFLGCSLSPNMLVLRLGRRCWLPLPLPEMGPGSPELAQGADPGTPTLHCLPGLPPACLERGVEGQASPTFPSDTCTGVRAADSSAGKTEADFHQYEPWSQGAQRG